MSLEKASNFPCGKASSSFSSTLPPFQPPDPAEHSANAAQAGGFRPGRGSPGSAPNTARPAPPRGLKMAAAVRRSWQGAVMAVQRVSVLLLLTAALLFFAGAVRAGRVRSGLVGAPQPIEDPENDEGLERALQFAMTAYNRASNDMYTSRVVRIISAEKQVSDWGRHSQRAGNEAGRIPLEKGQTASLRISAGCRFLPHRK